MLVQYCVGVSIVKDIISTFEGYHQFCGVSSVQWRIFSTVGDTISTVGDTISTLKRYLHYCRGIISSNVKVAPTVHVV